MTDYFNFILQQSLACLFLFSITTTIRFLGNVPRNGINKLEDSWISNDPLKSKYKGMKTKLDSICNC